VSRLRRRRSPRRVEPSLPGPLRGHDTDPLRRTRLAPRGERGASAVEFALLIPVLVLFVFGIIEVGRLMGTYSTVVTASREAARYGSAVGDNDDNVPRYRDCAEMRRLATGAGMRSSGLLAIDPVENVNISIRYDEGPTSETFVAECAPGADTAPAGVVRGHRVVVTVTRHFEPALPFVNAFGPFQVSSTDRRTIGGRASA
jgi:hypothetical protein